MRRRKADLRARVNGQLTFRYERAGLTSYAGLEFMRRYLRAIDFTATLRRELATALPASDYGVVGLVLVAARVTAERRPPRALTSATSWAIPSCCALCGLRQLPTARTVGRWLAAFRAGHLPPLQAVIAQLARPRDSRDRAAAA